MASSFTDLLFTSTEQLTQEHTMTASLQDSSSEGARTPEGDAQTCSTGTCEAPEVIEPNTMEALLREVMEEEDASDNEVVKELIRERLAEIRRLEDLLNNAKHQLAELMTKQPKEIAHSAAVSPSKGRMSIATKATLNMLASGSPSQRKHLGL